MSGVAWFFCGFSLVGTVTALFAANKARYYAQQATHAARAVGWYEAAQHLVEKGHEDAAWALSKEGDNRFPIAQWRRHVGSHPTPSQK